MYSSMKAYLTISQQVFLVSDGSHLVSNAEDDDESQQYSRDESLYSIDDEGRWSHIYLCLYETDRFESDGDRLTSLPTLYDLCLPITLNGLFVLI